MISWISGEIVDTWIKTKKIYVLINCQGLGYEVQILESLEKDLDKNKITLWIHQIKKEDSDFFFGFKDKEKRDFFRDLLQVRGIGPQISMSLLNKYDLKQIFNSIRNEDKEFFNSIPGIGQKMTERLFLELKNKITLWIHQIKKEDSDLFFGFKDKEKRDFFRDLLQVRGIGPQISMSLLNKYDLKQIFNSIRNEDKEFFNSIPGIGQKMTERLFLELKNKITVTYEINKESTEKPNHTVLKKEIKNLIDDVDLALKSLSYSLKERKKAINLILTKVDQSNLPIQKVLNSFTFEVLLKDSLDFLDKNK